MIYLMDLTLIEKIEINDVTTYFYEGIDFDMIKNHKVEDGFIIFFIDSYVDVIKTSDRENKIDSILYNKDPEDFNSEKYQKNNIAIYQTSGNLIPVYEAVKKKIIETDYQNNWKTTIL